jgi:hypothetical protein
MDLKYEHKYKKYKNKYNDLKGGGLYETINEFFNYPLPLTDESIAKITDAINIAKNNIKQIIDLIAEKIKSEFTSSEIFQARDDLHARSLRHAKGAKILEKNPLNIDIFKTELDKKMFLSDANEIFTKYNDADKERLTFYLYKTYITSVLSTLYTHINYIKPLSDSMKGSIKGMLNECDDHMQMIRFKPNDNISLELIDILKKVNIDYDQKMSVVSNLL